MATGWLTLGYILDICEINWLIHRYTPRRVDQDVNQLDTFMMLQQYMKTKLFNAIENEPYT